VDDSQCVIYFLGLEINTASFAMYTFSISVLFQALLVISISCAADHGNYRKRLLLTFAFVGSIATMLFLPVTPSVYLLGALFAIISNTCCGASFVLLNSFLPLLVRHHPKTQYARPDSPPDSHLDAPQYSHNQGDTDPTLVNSTAALLPPSNHPIETERTSIELQISTQISSTGIGIGYSAGLFLQCLSIVLLLLMKSTTFSLRLVLFLIGLWWFTFTIPAALWLRPRPGPPLPKHPFASNASSSPTSKTRTWLGYIAHSWLSLYRTIRLARRLTDIVLFLTSWFLLSDAIATVSGVSILFAKTHLSMSPPALALISVLATASGILGAFTWPLLSAHLGVKPVSTILFCIALFEFIPLYGLLAYLPFIQHWGVLGLQKPWEMYPLGILYGFVLGGLSSYCRSLYGELIPPGSEAAFYALYAITDKGSSIFGPAIVGVIVDRTGGIRPAFWFLVVLIGLPAPIIWWVDVERGKEEGRRLALLIEGFKDSAEPSGAASVDERRDLLADPAEGEDEEENDVGRLSRSSD
jgi:MFS transporter, UMF1 family